MAIHQRFAWGGKSAREGGGGVGIVRDFWRRDGPRFSAIPSLSRGPRRTALERRWHPHLLLVRWARVTRKTRMWRFVSPKVGRLLWWMNRTASGSGRLDVPCNPGACGRVAP